MLTIEEVAALLSEEEGRAVTVAEVRRIESIAMRKLRSCCVRMRIRAYDYVLDVTLSHPMGILADYYGHENVEMADLVKRARELAPKGAIFNDGKL